MQKVTVILACAVVGIICIFIGYWIGASQREDGGSTEIDFSALEESVGRLGGQVERIGRIAGNIEDYSERLADGVTALDGLVSDGRRGIEGVSAEIGGYIDDDERSDTEAQTEEPD